MSAFSVLPYTEEQQERWDRFVMEQSANGTFLQTRRFLSYHPAGRFRDDSRMIFHKQELVAVCPAADGLIGGRRAFRSHPGSTFGGLIVAPSLQRAPKLVELVSALNGQLLADGYELAELKQTSALFSCQPDEALEYALYQQGYMQETEISCWLPLDRPYDELRKAYSFNKRYDLKKAEKQGLSTAALETEEDIRQFHALLCLNLRKFDAVPVHTAEELIDFRHSRLRDEVSFLGLRTPEGALTAAACLFYFAQTNVLHTQYLATDTGITAYVPSTLLYDAVIREGLRRNCSAVSFGTCTHDRGRVLNTGLILNKEGYGTQHSLNRIFTKNLLSENGGAPV